MDEQSQSSAWWIFAWLVGGGLVGGGVGALIGYLTYHPSGFDFGRRFQVELLGGIGVLVGLLVGFIGFWVWWIRTQPHVGN